MACSISNTPKDFNDGNNRFYSNCKRFKLNHHHHFLSIQYQFNSVRFMFDHQIHYLLSRLDDFLFRRAEILSQDDFFHDDGFFLVLMSFKVVMTK